MNQNAENLPLITTASDKKLSKLQADFNAKIKQISDLKESIENVKKQSIEINQRLEKELTPLEKKRLEVHKEFATALVDAFHNLKMSKKDRETLTECIMSELWNLIHDHQQEDLIPLYNQFSDLDYKEELKQMNEDAQKSAFSMFENMTGMNLHDLDLGDDASADMDPMERMHRARIAFEEKMKNEAWEETEKRNNRKKSPKQEAKEQKMKEEAEMLTKSSRAIYMELAKELHPDREQDEEKRIWKTELMQRITAAYNENDLYALLSLRLEYKKNQMDSDSVPEKQLELYIKILKEQVSALREEYNSFFHMFNPMTKRLQQFGLGKAKQAVTRAINKEKKDIEKQMETMKYTQRTALKDPQAFKEYMKEQREQSMLDNSFGGLLESIFGGKF